jgi:hypothetical protein
MRHWLLPAADPQVGGGAANIRVNKSRVSWLTRFQEIEYALRNLTSSPTRVSSSCSWVVPAKAMRRLRG